MSGPSQLVDQLTLDGRGLRGDFADGGAGRMPRGVRAAKLTPAGEPALAAPPAPPDAPKTDTPDEPTAVDDDTVSAAPTVMMAKKESPRRRQLRRANAAKHASGAAGREVPAQTAPVKRKLINEL